MSIAIVLVGLPGSGKSTAARSMIHDSVFIYSTDAYIENLAAKSGKTYDELFKDSYKAAAKHADAQLTQAIKDGKNIVWDQTNLSRKKRLFIVSAIPDGYVKECLCIQPPVTTKEYDELYARLDARQDKTISRKLISNMLQTYEEPSVDEGFKRVTITDIRGNIIKVRQ
jgi:predicted kinase